ncbi:MAG: nuclear transport factor 2 family protein [Ginsengibacter sp.]
MRKTIPVMLAAAFMVLAAFTNPVKAQDHKKEMATLAQQFQNAYNKKEVKALEGFYTKDAVRVNADGTTTDGNKAIAEVHATDFKQGINKIKITVSKDEPGSDGSVMVTGTFRVTGTSPKGEKIDMSGNYVNTVVKENGHWKISKSVITKK